MKKGIFFSFILTALLLASCKGPVVNTDTNTNTETPDVAEESTMKDDTADDTDAMEDADADDEMMDDDMEMSDDTNTMDDDMSDDMSDTDDETMKDDAMIEANVDVNVETQSAGTYAPYTEEAAANASGKVVLAFHADWCPTCVTARKNLNENSDDIPAGVTILDVNYDDAQALKEKYNVTSQHTYVQIDSAGELLKKWKGGSTVAEITGQVQ